MGMQPNWIDELQDLRETLSQTRRQRGRGRVPATLVRGPKVQKHGFWQRNVTWAPQKEPGRSWLTGITIHTFQAWNTDSYCQIKASLLAQMYQQATNSSTRLCLKNAVCPRTVTSHLTRPHLKCQLKYDLSQINVPFIFNCRMLCQSRCWCGKQDH